MTCGNCFGDPADLEEHCVAAALIAVRDDDDWTFEQRLETLANLDANAFWNDIGPIIDRLEDGYYNIDNDERPI